VKSATLLAIHAQFQDERPGGHTWRGYVDGTAMTEHVRWMRLPATIERHQHAHPYAAVVLSGSDEEAGESGRWRVSAGEVLIQRSKSAW
jgi:hypothetical protein